MDSSTPPEVEDLLKQVENLKAGMREAAHEINNPLGVMRMATYFLESGNPDAEKRIHYFRVINESIDKIELCLRRMKLLRENPSVDIAEHRLPDESDPASGKTPGA